MNSATLILKNYERKVALIKAADIPFDRKIELELKAQERKDELFRAFDRKK